MPPAHQGLHAAGMIVAVELQLEGQLERFALQGTMQLLHQQQPLACAGVEPAPVAHAAVAAEALGLGAGLAGRAQQRDAVDAVVGETAVAEAGGHVERGATHFDGPRHRQAQRFHTRRRIAFRIQGKQDSELVAAEACHRSPHTRRGFEPARNRDQQFVANAMAQAVVDQLEAVQVEVADREPAAGTGIRAIDVAHQDVTVGQAREHVVTRAEGHLLGCALAQRHIVDDAHDAGRRAVDIGHRSQPDLQVADGKGIAAVGDLQAGITTARVRRAQAAHVRKVEQCAECSARGRRRRCRIDPGQAGECGVRIHQLAAWRLQDERALVRRFDRAAHDAHVLAQVANRVLARGDALPHPDLAPGRAPQEPHAGKPGRDQQQHADRKRGHESPPASVQRVGRHADSRHQGPAVDAAVADPPVEAIQAAAGRHEPRIADGSGGKHRRTAGIQARVQGPGIRSGDEQAVLVEQRGHAFTADLVLSQYFGEGRGVEVGTLPLRGYAIVRAHVERHGQRHHPAPSGIRSRRPELQAVGREPGRRCESGRLRHHAQVADVAVSKSDPPDRSLRQRGCRVRRHSLHRLEADRQPVQGPLDAADLLSGLARMAVHEGLQIARAGVATHAKVVPGHRHRRQQHAQDQGAAKPPGAAEARGSGAAVISTATHPGRCSPVVPAFDLHRSVLPVRACMRQLQPNPSRRRRHNAFHASRRRAGDAALHPAARDGHDAGLDLGSHPRGAPE